MPTYRLLLEYDGTHFSGWQTQPGRRTVQETLETALATLLKTRVGVVGSGRTDAGVHARAQVAHFNFPTAIDAHRLHRGLGALVGPEVAVLACEAAPEDFHARFDACRRVYHYRVSTAPRALDRTTRLWLRPAPDFERMNDAALCLLGQHHFGAFCRTQSDTENRVCTVEVACWEPEERPGDWRFRVEADRFLHGMVRSIVGTLLEVGRGKIAAEDVRDILATQDRRAAGPAAPARGLVLERVEYETRGVSPVPRSLHAG